MQSYGVMEQETTKSLFFVSVTCGGDTISATDSEHFDITVAKKTEAALASVSLFSSLGNRSMTCHRGLSTNSNYLSS